MVDVSCLKLVLGPYFPAKGLDGWEAKRERPVPNPSYPNASMSYTRPVLMVSIFRLGVPAIVSIGSPGFQQLCRQLQADLVVVGVAFIALPLYVIDSDL